jgi:predicted HAD superfamily hydrolase
MQTKATTTKIINLEVTMVYGLISLIFALIGLYMYFLSASIMHVVMRTEVEQKISAVQSELSSLETELMLAHHRVSSDIASLEGYVEPLKKHFIDRGEQSLVLRDAP